jgi:hypothetical protein
MPLSYGLSGAIFAGKMADGVQIITITRSKVIKRGSQIAQLGNQGGGGAISVACKGAWMLQDLWP